jgi:hypothetical protein
MASSFLPRALRCHASMSKPPRAALHSLGVVRALDVPPNSPRNGPSLSLGRYRIKRGRRLGIPACGLRSAAYAHVAAHIAKHIASSETAKGYFSRL